MNKYSSVKVNYCYIGADGAQHSEPGHPVFYSRIEEQASNASTLKDAKYINTISILFENADDISDPEKKGLIFQVGGYSPRRGLFVDYYGPAGRLEE